MITTEAFWKCAGVALWLALPAPASGSGVTVTELRVDARSGAPELRCEPAGRPSRPPPPADPDPAEIPSVAMLTDEGLGFRDDAAAPGLREPSPLGRARPGEPFRMGVWADSHLATGAFTDELVRLLNVPAAQVSAALVPASMNRPGVRLPLRKSCTGPQWRHEPGHVPARATRAIGPGLINLYSERRGAWLAWDLRTSSGAPQWASLQVLLEQTASPLKLGISVDGGPAREVALSGPAGPAALALRSERPLSTVRITLLSGTLRLLGLALPEDTGAMVQLDLFAYPGATVGGWELADGEYLAAWYQARRYDLVVLAFGTNEGNVHPFDAGRYESSLRAAVARFRALFPEPACVIVGPPDRGVLVPRSQKAKRGAARAGARPAGAPNLLRYTEIHGEITRLQQAVAAEHGCSAWSMLEAMGGAGSAYQWAYATPPLMASDLIHLTPNGYRELARRFASDLGWDAAQLLSRSVP